VTREVTRAGKLITLTAKEYALLELLALNKGRVLSRTIITEHLYDQNFDLDSNIIDVFINRLRSKIDRDFEKKLIHTIRGAGYTLRD
jgi:DNA-binding response OmpR family regulator